MTWFIVFKKWMMWSSCIAYNGRRDDRKQMTECTSNELYARLYACRLHYRIVPLEAMSLHCFRRLWHFRLAPLVLELQGDILRPNCVGFWRSWRKVHWGGKMNLVSIIFLYQYWLCELTPWCHCCVVVLCDEREMENFFVTWLNYYF